MVVVVVVVAVVRSTRNPCARFFLDFRVFLSLVVVTANKVFCPGHVKG